MRISLALFAFLALTGVACNDTTSSSSNPCANSGAAATVTATDNFAFTPESVTIAVGQSVCWQNTGHQTHTVTENTAGRFNGSLPAGQTFIYTFTFNSSFGYHCNQHSTMTGTVIVN